VRNADIFVCPQHAVGGWAPTCFTTPPVDPSASRSPLHPLMDTQAPRLGYVANELPVPRKKCSTVPQQTVKQDIVEGPADTIILAEHTDRLNALLDTSATGGDSIKSHRSTNAVTMGGAVFDGEAYVPVTPVTALTYQQAIDSINAAIAAAAMGNNHIKLLYYTFTASVPVQKSGSRKPLTLQLFAGKMVAW